MGEVDCLHCALREKCFPACCVCVYVFSLTLINTSGTNEGHVCCLMLTFSMPCKKVRLLLYLIWVDFICYPLSKESAVLSLYCPCFASWPWSSMSNSCYQGHLCCYLLRCSSPATGPDLLLDLIWMEISWYAIRENIILISLCLLCFLSSIWLVPYIHLKWMSSVLSCF